MENEQPPVQVAVAAPPPPPAVPAPQVAPPPARRGRRRRGELLQDATPARRGRTATAQGENNRGQRTTRSASRNVFYGNGDSEDDFV